MDFIYRTWPFLGLPLGVALASKAVVESKPSFSSLDATVPPRSSSLLRWLRTRDVAFWLQIALPIYMIHQFEEHGYDVFGRRYYFHEAFCKTFGGPDLESCPLTPAGIFFTNFVMVWLCGLAAWLDTKGSGPGANFLGLIIVNMVVHVLSYFAFGFEYNPGLLTGLILFLPTSYFGFTRMRADGVLSQTGLIRAIAVGVAVHIGLLCSLALARMGIIGDGLACLLQVLLTGLNVFIITPI